MLRDLSLRAVVMVLSWKERGVGGLKGFLGNEKGDEYSRVIIITGLVVLSGVVLWGTVGTSLRNLVTGLNTTINTITTTSLP